MSSFRRMSMVNPLMVVGKVLFCRNLSPNLYPAVWVPWVRRMKSLSVTSAYVVRNLSNVALAQ